MASDLKVPSVGESITEVHIGRWIKKEGDYAERDEAVVEIESEKATVEIVAPISGVISEILRKGGEVANIGEVIGRMKEGEAPKKATPTKTSKTEPQATGKPKDEIPMPPPVSEEPKREASRSEDDAGPPKDKEATRIMPAAQRALAEKGLDAGEVEATGPGGRLLKEDVIRHQKRPQPAPMMAAPAPGATTHGRDEDIVPMSPMRRSIAAHLVQAQQTAALLTTFNEVDMSNVLALRDQFQEAFEKKYEIRLGFMGFFVKAVIEALKLVPEVNAEIRGDNVVYRNYFDIGVAVSTQKGLVVPVLRAAEYMSFAEIELKVSDFARRARNSKITVEELTGGTFTISNGGVFGSLMSTPIVNPPQSGILGMHAIQERPVARDGQVVIRPMMYLAMTYDHRIVDGRGAVTCLKRIKECVENPSRILLEI